MSEIVRGVPENYRCARCTVRGCKLWREYEAFHVRLLCCDCVSLEADNVDVSEIDDMGHVRTGHYECRTDQLGAWIPAVPINDSNDYWNYNRVPDEDVLWWHRLPTRVPQPIRA